MADDKLDTPPLRLGERVLPNGRLRPEGLDEATIGVIVDKFYAAVRLDPLLGPVFNERIAPDEWPAHIALIHDFWSSMLLGSGRYGGRPMPKHLKMADVINDSHFERWLGLFKKTVEEVCPPDLAALFVDRAERIGQSFRLGMAFHRGEDTVGIEPIRAK